MLCICILLASLMYISDVQYRDLITDLIPFVGGRIGIMGKISALNVLFCFEKCFMQKHPKYGSDKANLAQPMNHT